MTPARPVGVILAGGASSRFGGRPKGLELVGGRRIVDRVRDALYPHVSRIILSSNAKEARNWLDNVDVVADNPSMAGGLAGVEAGLRAAGPEVAGVIVAAWDMPFVSRAVVAVLADAARAGSASAIVPASRSPHGLEPFCAFYSATLLPRLQKTLADGPVAAHAFLRSLDDLQIIALPGVDTDIAFMSVNTDDDLERARRLADAQ